jgi:hypothetical protein
MIMDEEAFVERWLRESAQIFLPDDLLDEIAGEEEKQAMETDRIRQPYTNEEGAGVGLLGHTLGQAAERPRRYGAWHCELPEVSKTVSYSRTPVHRASHSSRD